MDKLSTFQVVSLAIFGVLIVVGVGVFAAFGGLLGNTAVGPVTLWGTLDSAAMTNLLEALRSQDKSFENITYAEKDPATYENDLLNALASGNGPDLMLLPDRDVQSFRDKVLPLSYGAMSRGAFTSSFIDEAQMLLTPSGELGLPFSVDPLVMYWNTDLYAAAGVASPPQYWNQLIDAAPKITAFDTGKNVKKSAAALGSWNNIGNAKAILSTLIMQAGDGIVSVNSQGMPVPVLGAAPASAPENPAASALRFYTQFANPSQSVYSWNRSLPKDSDSFAAGDLATYFGFSSEYSAIAARNPNLHFGVALLPQIQVSSARLTAGNMLVLAIPKTARNPSGAATMAQKFTAAAAAAAASQKLGLAPVRRDLLSDTPSSAAGSVFVRSALIARGWLDPSPAATDGIFKGMVESVASGAADPTQAVAAAARDFTALFPQAASASAPGAGQ